MSYQKKKNNKVVSEDNKQKVILLEELLFKLGTYKTISSLMNNLQVLNFDENILNAMQESKISYKLAYLLNKSIEPLTNIYQDRKIVNEKLDFIITSEYSVTQADKFIKNIIQSNVKKDELEIK